jgi:type VI secretion system FHA domain protein
MVLAIYAARHAGEEFAEPVTTVLNAAQYMIGRGQECDIVLEDQTRRVSRKHATILRRPDGYLLHVISQINPVVVNGEVVGPGAQQPLRAGDRMAIGEYEFGFVAVEEGEPLSILPANPVSARSQPVDLDRLFGAQPLQPRASAAPKPPPSDLQDLLGNRETRAPDPLLDILGRPGDASRSPGAVPASDPLAGILGRDAASTPATTGSPDEFLHGAGAESPIDALLQGSGVRGSDPLGLAPERPPVHGRGQFGGGRGGSDELDHVHDFNLPLPGSAASPGAAAPAAPRGRAFAPPPVLPDPPPPPAASDDPLAKLLGDNPSRPPADDPLGIFGAMPPASPAAPPSPPRAASPLPFDAVGANTEPSVLLHAPSVRARPATASPRQSAPTPDGQSAIAAFLRGAGMQGANTAQVDADRFLEECGATVRAAVEGLMGMLLARAKVKEELRAVDRTMVAARENNPLKLSDSVDEALQFVFDPGARNDAFLPPAKAVADACNDLQAHELALVAGLRAALLGAIQRFDPEAIEKRLQKEGGKSLLANRKAQLWDCFVAYYRQTQADVDDNFDRVFGAAFLRAYQEQVRRLGR